MVCRRHRRPRHVPGIPCVVQHRETRQADSSYSRNCDEFGHHSAWVDVDRQRSARFSQCDGKHVADVGNQDTAVFTAQNCALNTSTMPPIDLMHAIHYCHSILIIIIIIITRGQSNLTKSASRGGGIPRLATVHVRDNQPTNQPTTNDQPTNDVTTQPISISASFTKVK